MIDFVMGWVLGRKSVKKDIEPEVAYVPEKPVIKEKTKIAYVPIPDITDIPADLEGSYRDYEKFNLIAIVRDGHIYYYQEVEVPVSTKFYGYQKIEDFI